MDVVVVKVAEAAEVRVVAAALEAQRALGTAEADQESLVVQGTAVAESKEESVVVVQMVDWRV